MEDPMQANPSMTGFIADPGPVGLAAFAMTTFMLSVFNTNMVSTSLATSVLPLALFYGGAVQLLAGMWEFRKGNTFGALAFSSFGAFWLSYWYLVDHVAPTLKGPDAHKAIAVFLLGWAIFTAYMTIASLRTTAAIAAVFLALTITFILLTIGAFATGDTAVNWTKAGGWAGLVTAALAWYASFAGVTNATFRRTMMPVFPLTMGGMDMGHGRTGRGRMTHSRAADDRTAADPLTGERTRTRTDR